MNGYANAMLTTLLGWMRSCVYMLWQLVSGEGGGAIQWIAEHWKVLIIALCVVCVAVDAAVYMLRWRSYRVWASFFRRRRRKYEEKHSGEHVRRWVYADGRARTERVSADEVRRDQVQIPVPAVREETPETVAALPEEAAAPQDLSAYMPPRRQERQRRADRHAVPTVGKRIGRLLASPVEDDVRMVRYQGGSLPTEKEQAYNEPYIPPQWKRPEDADLDGR